MSNRYKKCKHRDGDRHDCRYVDAIERLIPTAELLADEACGPPPTQRVYYQQWCLMWNKIFTSEMEMLAAKAGLRSPHLNTIERIEKEEKEKTYH